MMQKQSTQPRYTIILEPYRDEHDQAWMVIRCPQNLWVQHHLMKIPGVSLNKKGELVMPNIPIQVRRLMQRLKVLESWAYEAS